MSLNSHRPRGLVGRLCCKGGREGERESCREASWELSKRAGKINMVLNIHYLCLSVGWEVPWGGFSCDGAVMGFFSFQGFVMDVTHTPGLAAENYNCTLTPCPLTPGRSFFSCSCRTHTHSLSLNDLSLLSCLFLLFLSFYSSVCLLQAVFLSKTRTSAESM